MEKFKDFIESWFYDSFQMIIINGMTLLKKNKENIKILTRREIKLKNGERWIRILTLQSARDLRYYKIKVDKNIDIKFLEQVILPCCVYYCKEIEWI